MRILVIHEAGDFPFDISGALPQRLTRAGVKDIEICCLRTHETEGMTKEQFEGYTAAIVHLGGLNDDEYYRRTEQIGKIIEQIRSASPFCRIGIESQVYFYRTGVLELSRASTTRERRVRRAEELLKGLVPDFFFCFTDPCFDGTDSWHFLCREVAKGFLTNEEIKWREAGNTITPMVEIGPGGRRIERI